MFEVRQTAIFAAWLADLADSRARSRIAERLRRVAQGNVGDTKSIGDGVGELRIDYGPGYRVYFARRGNEVILLLCGGDKSSQRRDIAAAKALAKEV